MGSSPKPPSVSSLIRYQVTGIRYQVTGIRYQVTGIRYQVTGIRYQVTGIRYQVTGIRYQVTGIRYQVSYLSGLGELLGLGYLRGTIGMKWWVRVSSW